MRYFIGVRMAESSGESLELGVMRFGHSLDPFNCMLIVLRFLFLIAFLHL
jgi:hypothetical protein